MSRTRRQILLTGMALSGAAAALGAVTFRLHATPQRHPFLVPEHLASLADNDLPHPRVLFVGNSMLLRHDVPGLVAGQSRFHTAMAAADGARLVETARLDGFREAVANGGWDAVVLQDFTKTPLRAIDRFASAQAMRWIARQSAPAKVLLYPPWPAADGNSVYRDAGRLTTTPQDPHDFARRTMAHYSSVAEDNGFQLVPVPLAWLDAKDPALYDDDGHHASVLGAQFVARLIAEALERMV
jgi:hypothetical protein